MSNAVTKSVVFEKTADGVRPGIVEVDTYTTDNDVSRIKSQVLGAFSATYLKEIKTKAGDKAETGTITHEDYLKIVDGKPLVEEKVPAAAAKAPTSPEVLK